jgi:hypothetical protein
MFARTHVCASSKSLREMYDVCASSKSLREMYDVCASSKSLCEFEEFARNYVRMSSKSLRVIMFV